MRESDKIVELFYSSVGHNTELAINLAKGQDVDLNCLNNQRYLQEITPFELSNKIELLHREGCQIPSELIVSCIDKHLTVVFEGKLSHKGLSDYSYTIRRLYKQIPLNTIDSKVIKRIRKGMELVQGLLSSIIDIKGRPIIR